MLVNCLVVMLKKKKKKSCYVFVCTSSWKFLHVLGPECTRSSQSLYKQVDLLVKRLRATDRAGQTFTFYNVVLTVSEKTKK